MLNKTQRDSLAAFVADRAESRKESFRYGSGEVRFQMLDDAERQMRNYLRAGDLGSSQMARIELAFIDWTVDYLKGVTCIHPDCFTQGVGVDVWCQSCKTLVSWREL